MKTKAKFWYCSYKYYRDKLNILIFKLKKTAYANIFKKLQ